MAAGLLLCALCLAAPISVLAQESREIEALVLMPEELGAGFSIVFEERDADLSSFFRVLERRSPSLAVVGVTLWRDPEVTPREAVAVLIRPFLAAYLPGEPYAPSGFPGGAFAIPLIGGDGGRQTTGVVLAWQEANLLVSMSVLVESEQGMAADPIDAEIERYVELQHNKIADSIAARPSPTVPVSSSPRSAAPPAQVPAQAPAQPLDR